MATAPRRYNRGPERYVLSLALLLPLGIAMLAASQLIGGPGAVSAGPVARADAGTALLTKRPVTSNVAPPPTLVPPTPRPPTPTAVPTPVPEKPSTYVVQPGDELKHIAADYGISIWKIIDANDIPNPDSLRVGQVLRIPDS